MPFVSDNEQQKKHFETGVEFMNKRMQEPVIIMRYRDFSLDSNKIEAYVNTCAYVFGLGATESEAIGNLKTRLILEEINLNVDIDNLPIRWANG